MVGRHPTVSRTARPPAPAHGARLVEEQHDVRLGAGIPRWVLRPIAGPAWDDISPPARPPLPALVQSTCGAGSDVRTACPSAHMRRHWRPRCGSAACRDLRAARHRGADTRTALHARGRAYCPGRPRHAVCSALRRLSESGRINDDGLRRRPEPRSVTGRNIASVVATVGVPATRRPIQSSPSSAWICVRPGPPGGSAPPAVEPPAAASVGRQLRSKGVPDARASRRPDSQTRRVRVALGAPHRHQLVVARPWRRWRRPPR